MRITLGAAKGPVRKGSLELSLYLYTALQSVDDDDDDDDDDDEDDEDCDQCWPAGCEMLPCKHTDPLNFGLLCTLFAVLSLSCPDTRRFSPFGPADSPAIDD
ncbi:hypothetical protein K0M31_015633 [Melipona bicolor]|uniref:Uncharacterized protein n=1 Tax=Melipona bicolor TaxID=60889 RepID=A0AA40KF02_9HYME|nr:hypothetical protein K0M31_015633 [Melipona bicolor]